MLEISPQKIGHIIVRAREYDAKVGTWDEKPSTADEGDADTILEDFAGDATRSELHQFIAGLNEDEQASLVAVTWIGRGSYTADELLDAIEMAKAERTNATEDYLLGEPLLSDYLEEGLDKLGYSVEDAEKGML